MGVGWRVGKSWRTRCQKGDGAADRLAASLMDRVRISRSLARVNAKGIGEVLILRIPGGVDAIPLGWFFSERAPGLFVQAGHDLVPAGRIRSTINLSCARAPTSRSSSTPRLVR